MVKNLTMNQWDAYMQFKIDVWTARSLLTTEAAHKDFDRKNVIAIRKANWSIEAIADLMSLSIEEVLEILQGEEENIRLKAEVETAKAEMVATHEKLKNVVLNTHKAGVPVETIAELTSFSVEEIKAILENT